MNMDNLVENKLLTVAGRIAIVVATAALPVIATIGAKVAWSIVDKIDGLSSKVDDVGTSQKLLDQSVQFGFRESKADIGNVRTTLSDHESRLRQVERMAR